MAENDLLYMIGKKGNCHRFIIKRNYTQEFTAMPRIVINLR